MTAKVRYLVFAADLADGDTEGPFTIDHATSADFVLAFPGGRTGLTIEGAFVERLLNQTGSPSVKGTVVEPNSGAVADRGFKVVGADEPDPIGVVYEDGIADGSLCWVVKSGSAQVLLEDSVAGVRGYWGRVSATQDGRMTVAATPPGGGIPELDQHVREGGHCAQSIDAGTDVLCWFHVHYL